MLAAEDDLGVRSMIYQAFWDLVIEGADNLAYRRADGGRGSLHAIPFFVLLLVVEAISFRHYHDDELVGSSTIWRTTGSTGSRT